MSPRMQYIRSFPSELWALVFSIALDVGIFAGAFWQTMVLGKSCDEQEGDAK